MKKLLIISGVIISLFIAGLLFPNSDLMFGILLLPTVWMIHYRNIRKGWFWILFFITGILLSLKIENSFISGFVSSISFPSLIFAIRRTFFARRKNVEIAKKETEHELGTITNNLATMKNKTIAIIGIGSYILSVITSATDDKGNSVSPNILIGLSGIITIIFTILATIRLWKEARYLSIMLASSEIVLTGLTIIQVGASSQYGSPIIILLNITKVVHLIVFIWAIITLFRLNSLPIRSNRDEDEKLKDEKLLDRAMEVLSHGYPIVSANLFQRELLIGHSAALRLLDTLEEKGVLGPGDHPLFRKVLINDPKKLQPSCLVCESTKINESEETCESCQTTINDVLKSVAKLGYTTWPILHEELRIGYAGVIRTLDYMVKKKILLPPDKNGNYLLAT